MIIFKKKNLLRILLDRNFYFFIYYFRKKYLKKNAKNKILLKIIFKRKTYL